MKNFIILLSMIYFASSCRSPERALICKAIEDYQVRPTESCIVSVKHNTCYCADFDVNLWENTSDLRREPLDYCEGFQGVRIEFGQLNIKPNFKALQRLKEESCQKQKRKKDL